MELHLQEFLWGALSMSAWVAGLFFHRLWRLGRDRLLLFFSFAFWILALNWLCLALADPANEATHWVYILRVVAFALIIVAIVDKNRRVRSADESARAPASRDDVGARSTQ